MKNLLAGAIAYAITGIAYAVIGLFMIGILTIGLAAGVAIIYLMLMAGINTLREILGLLL